MAAIITSPFDYPTEHYEPYITFLREQYNLVLELEAASDRESRSREQEMVLAHKKGKITLQLKSFERLFSEISLSKRVFRSSVDGKERKEEVIVQPSRYLCVSNGFEIWCLHLKQTTTVDDVLRPPPSLVKFAELKLHAVSASLFKLGSDAYVIGGLELPPVYLMGMDMDNYHRMCRTYIDNIEGSSLDTYRLSMDASDATLSRSEFDCRMGKLNSPKFWPIVEEIEGNIHVIDSLPRRLRKGHRLVDWGTSRIFSHEVFTWVEGSWRVMSVSTIKDYEYVSSHLVVGNRIYAVGDLMCMMFDSEMSGWKASKKDSHDKQVWRDPVNVEHVWHILDLGMARCVGQFPVKLGRETVEEQGPLYVVVAVIRKWRSPIHKRSNDTIAVAYLVTLTGRVVCYQHLPHFFKGQKLQPSRMSVGTMISIVEEGEKMFAAVVNGKAWGWGSSKFLFINTFTVEVLTESAAASHVQKFWRERREDGWPKEQEFVHVAVKESYIYETETEAGNCCTYFPTLQACFL